MIEGLKAAGPVLVVDAGHAYARGHGAVGDDQEQSLGKARLIAEGYQLGGIDAMLPGRGEDAFGRDVIEGTAKEFSLPYVVSNAECSRALPFPTRIDLERGGAKIEVFGIWSSDSKYEGCRPTEPAAALKSATAGDTVVIVLSDQTEVDDAALVKAVPAIDLIVRSESNKMLGTPSILPNGGLLLSSGAKGKTLGVLSVVLTPGAVRWRDSGASEEKARTKDNATARVTELGRRIEAAEDEKDRARLEKQLAFWKERERTASQELEATLGEQGAANVVLNELRGLGTEIGEHPATFALVAAFKQATTGISSAPPEPSASPATPPPEGPFVGTAVCSSCHPAQAAQWSTTGHAKAWASLVTASRPFDEDCWRCHATGAFSPGGPTNPRTLGPLENVGCESCHGAGREHAASPTQGRMVKVPPVSQCTQCHDQEQDEGRFNAETYFPKVAH